MKKKDGKDFEKLVEFIEKCVDKEARIERDVQLPNLKLNDGTTEQIDLVIRTGKSPREFVTIVEIQDRISAVKANDFRGWIGKLDDVGANRLICVSRKEFTKTQKKLAAMENDRIKLISVSEIIPEDFPDILGNKTITIQEYPKVKEIFEGGEISVLKDDLKRLNLKLTDIQNVVFSNSYQSRIFSLSKKYDKSLDNLLVHALSMNNIFEQNEGVFRLKISLKTDPLYIKIGNEFVKTGINFQLRWSCDLQEKPWKVMTYKQNDHGVLGWLIEAQFKTSYGELWIGSFVEAN